MRTASRAIVGVSTGAGSSSASTATNDVWRRPRPLPTPDRCVMRCTPCSVCQRWPGRGCTRSVALRVPASVCSAWSSVWRVLVRCAYRTYMRSSRAANACASRPPVRMMGRGVGAGGRSARVRSRDRSSSSSVLRSMSSSNDVSSILALSASRASCSRACRALGCAPPLFGGVHDGVQPARERRPPFQLSNLHVVVLLWLEHASLWESAPRVIGSVLAPMSADVGEDVISALAGMNPMNMRERSRFARWLFRQESSIVRLAAALLALLAVFMTVHVHAHLSGVPVVTDGDTLKIGSERIRLHGIDAPESAQRCRARGQTWACGAAATGAFVRNRSVRP